MVLAGAGRVALTVNTVTSLLLRISSTRASGFPRGAGMVPRTTAPGVAST